MGGHPRNTCACSLLRALKGAQAAGLSMATMEETTCPSPTRQYMAVVGSQQETHTQAPPACMRCLSQQNTDWLHRYRGDKHSNRPSTHSKGSLSCRDREESSHHIWLGCIWVPAPQPRPGWDRRPDELCQLLSSSLMQTRRLTADPAPQRQVGHLAQAPRSSEATGREGVAVAEALRAKGTDTSDRCAGRRGQSLVRAQWAKSWC